jgi:hypothetical protein
MFASLPDTLIVDASRPVDQLAGQIGAVLLNNFLSSSFSPTEVIFRGNI